MQYLVFVHNLSDGRVVADAVHGDAPVAPLPNAPMTAYARIWIDALEADLGSAIELCISEALQWPREHGEKVVHMTATTSLELELGPGFDQAQHVSAALRETLGAAFDAGRLRASPGLSKSA